MPGPGWPARHPENDEKAWKPYGNQAFGPKSMTRAACWPAGAFFSHRWFSFPPIVFFIVGDRVESYYQNLSKNLEFKKIPASLFELTSIQLDVFLFLFLLGLTCLFLSFIDLASLSAIPKTKLLIGTTLIIFIYLYSIKII